MSRFRPSVLSLVPTTDNTSDQCDTIEYLARKINRKRSRFMCCAKNKKFNNIDIETIMLISWAIILILSLGGVLAQSTQQQQTANNSQQLQSINQASSVNNEPAATANRQEQPSPEPYSFGYSAESYGECLIIDGQWP